MNIKGYESIDQVMEHATRPIDANELEWMLNLGDVLLLDTRDADEFGKEFIPNSINIGLKGIFAVWAGTIIPDIKQKIILITEPGREKEAAIRLARVGYDNTVGYLAGGIDAWKKAGFKTSTIVSISANELAYIASLSQILNIIDVRKHSEFDNEHIENALNIPLDYINDEEIPLAKNKYYFVHCAAGYRSMAFISILKKRGYNNLVNITGGFNAMKASRKFTIAHHLEHA